MTKSDIETAAFDLQSMIWKNRISLSIDAGPPVEMLHPSIGAAALGVTYDISADLGNFGFRGERFAVAGSLDRSKKLIQVSSAFCEATQRFTGAHELGHFLLHRGEVMYRDRPIVGSSAGNGRREEKEWQADYFAACFLMPKKLVLKEFEKRYGCRKPFDFDDNAAYWLSPNDPERVFNATAEERASILTNATKYSQRFFPRLSDEFQVSTQAMSIRLIELGIVV